VAYAQVDGDYIMLSNNIEVEIWPMSLSIMVPK